MLGKAVGIELGEDELAICDDLKTPAPGGDQDELAKVGLEVLQNSCRQTDGFGLVASHRAILDTNLLELHRDLRPGRVTGLGSKSSQLEGRRNGQSLTRSADPEREEMQ